MTASEAHIFASRSRRRAEWRRLRMLALTLMLVCSGAIAQPNPPMTAPPQADTGCLALRARVQQLQLERDRLKRQLELLRQQLDEAHDKLRALRKIEQSINRDNSSETPP